MATFAHSNIVGVNKIYKGGAIKKLYKGSSLVKEAYKGASLIYRLDNYYLRFTPYSNPTCIAYLAYEGGTATLPVQSYYIPGASSSTINVSYTSSTYTTSAKNMNPYIITRYNGTVTQDTSGNQINYTIYQYPCDPTVTPANNGYTYIYSTGNHNIDFCYNPQNIYTTTQISNSTSWTNLTGFLAYSSSNLSHGGKRYTVYAYPYPYSSTNWDEKYGFIQCKFSTQYNYQTVTADVKHWIVRKPYLKVKIRVSSSVYNGSKRLGIAVQSNEGGTNYYNTGLGNYYSAFVLFNSTGSSFTTATFARASSMAIPAPTTDYIRYITSAALLDGLYYNRLEDWASATGGHTWGLSSSGFSIELMIPEEIFYNSATRTIRFYFAVDWSTCRTNNSSAPTYTITSNNSSTAIYRFGSSKWAFYSNSFTRANIISKQDTSLIDINISKS